MACVRGHISYVLHEKTDKNSLQEWKVSDLGTYVQFPPAPL